MSFHARLTAAARTNNSWLCIGLDPDPTLMPPVSVLEFNKAIIDATRDLVCAYKPNLAFYQTFGPAGLEMLFETVRYIDGAVPVIADAKCADVGHTAAAYAHGLLQTFGCDAVTVNPYLGYDGVEPFLAFEDKGVFLLCRTSNPGAADLQGLRCIDPSDGQTERRGAELLFEVVARKALSWNSGDRLGLVVGATSPRELQRVREICPNMLLLIPGVGPQGGDLEESIQAGIDSSGESAIINASRQVIYASRGGDFPAAAREVALHLRDRINAVRQSVSLS